MLLTDDNGNKQFLIGNHQRLVFKQKRFTDMDKVIIRGNDFYKKRETLEKVRIDSDGWEVYYIDRNNGEKWIQEYPHSEMHGGGPPQLRLIDSFPWDDK